VTYIEGGGVLVGLTAVCDLCAYLWASFRDSSVLPMFLWFVPIMCWSDHWRTCAAIYEIT